MEVKMFNQEEKVEKIDDYIEILNKLVELEKEKKKNHPIKITICIVGGIGSVPALWGYNTCVTTE